RRTRLLGGDCRAVRQHTTYGRETTRYARSGLDISGVAHLSCSLDLALSPVLICRACSRAHARSTKPGLRGLEPTHGPVAGVETTGGDGGDLVQRHCLDPRRDLHVVLPRADRGEEAELMSDVR